MTKRIKKQSHVTMKNHHIEIDAETQIPVLRGRISCNEIEVCQIAIYCPYCKKEHFHGWPDRTTDSEHLEHRLCHCVNMPDHPRTESPFMRRGYMIGIDPAAHNEPATF